MSKKKVKKYRGSRTCGGGTHKNRRGAGSRGGRGNAGTCKHHAVRAAKRGLSYGKKGFHKPNAHRKTIVNVGELDEIIEQLVADEIARVEDGVYHLNLAELGIDKVLGKGKVTKALVLHAGEVTQTAIDKIEQAGGSIKLE
jgi:large subunit ribosomal protein L15